MLFVQREAKELFYKHHHNHNRAGTCKRVCVVTIDDYTTEDAPTQN